ncbi:heterokaryon incompatibility protein-domain-containing protein, partial [Podospora aff. communis PSN243]
MATMADKRESSQESNFTPQLRSWIEDCEMLHPKCKTRTRKPTFMPSRLLDLSPLLGDTGMVRLVVTTSIAKEQTSKRYLALSYCWGDGGPSCKTTSTNLASRLEGFLLSSLPSTHRDFIRIAQRLGVPYVWIDSLCILQDSSSDWKQESKSMGLIYSNAYFTVSALEPNNASAGIFRVCLTTATEGSEAPEPSGSANKADLSEWEERFRTAALNKRGWTVQERELSTRIVHFYQDEMFWECRTAQATWSSPRLQLKTFLGQYFRILDSSSIHARGNLSVLASWRKMVEDYTSRSLKVPGDRLHALSGIASMVKEHLGCDYVSGLWAASIVDDLHWITTGPKPPYPEEGRAPSWSWAAFDCPIKFVTHGFAGSPYHTFMG